MLEYGLLVGLVAIAAIAGMTLLGNELKQMFTDAAGKV
jgi:Flp pilus assembly pilin Flp